MSEEKTEQSSVEATEGGSQQVGTLSDLDKIETPSPEQPTEEKKEEKIEVVKAEDSEPVKAKTEEAKIEETPSEEKIKSDGLVTDDLIKKAQTEGVEALSKEEQKHLVDEGILKSAEEVESTPTSEFKSEIEKLTGEELDVDLSDAPLNTPEGLSKYLDAFADRKVGQFEEMLETRFPQAYRALQIESEGGDVTEYFKSQQVEGTDFTKVSLSEDDVTQHKQIIRSSLKLKGVDDSTIDDIIKLAEDGNKLKEKATPELKYLQSTQEQQAQAYTQKVELQKQQDMRVMQGMVNTVDSLVERGEIGNFTIPKSDRNTFLDHLKQNIEFKDGEFYVTKKVTPDTLEQIAQAEFFNFKKGDLSKYIKRAADSKLVLDLKSRMKKDNIGLSDEGRDALKGYTPLGDM
jgi:hypothetical protein